MSTDTTETGQNPDSRASDTDDDHAHPAVTLVLHAMTDELHESLCHCVDYPEGCKSRSDYRRDNLVHNLTYAEAALEMALKMGWTPPGAV